MRILIAEDDLIARKVLSTFLTKCGHEVQAAADGQDAWIALQAPDAPAVVVLDWMMPQMSGVEICRRLSERAGRPRPYIILLSARAEKRDVATGLDAGADDYLSKPFNAVELLARLRVAQRTMGFQRELARQIDELQHLLKRHHLLGEMVSSQAPVLTPAPAEPFAGAALKDPKQARRGLPYAPSEIDQLILRAMEDLKLAVGATTGEPPRSTSAGTDYAAAIPLVVTGEGLWFDLVIEAGADSAWALYEKLLGREPRQPADVADVLAEILTIIATTLKKALMLKGREALLPYLSRGARIASAAAMPSMPADREIHFCTWPQWALKISLISQGATVCHKSLGQLQPGDVMGDSFRSASGQEVLLNKGIALNERFIEKLSLLLAAEEKAATRLMIYEPSELARSFVGRESDGMACAA